jgi:hypothetical protein
MQLGNDKEAGNMNVISLSSSEDEDEKIVEMY